ncbi:hypothetical protein GQ44DRAFT_725303 [Phaeosphaeriaceae sp. PMI808]|nr:hypothetical protein GQ44DRAFT_725303 [Phaeosphaeriaceae sp. PMI808]
MYQDAYDYLMLTAPSHITIPYQNNAQGYSTGFDQALVNALDVWKRTAQQKISEMTATQVGVMQPTRTSWQPNHCIHHQPSNQGIRRSERKRKKSHRLGPDDKTLGAASNQTLRMGLDDSRTFIARYETDTRYNAPENMDINCAEESAQRIGPTYETLFPPEQSSAQCPPPLYTRRFGDGTIDPQELQQHKEYTEHSTEDMEPIDYVSESSHQLEPSHEALQSPEEQPGTLSCRLDDRAVPQLQFDELFEGLYGKSSSQTDGQGSPADRWEIETSMADQSYQNQTRSLAQDPTARGYLDLASHSNFCLPHESLEDGDRIGALETLHPLVEETPLTARLLHGLLYTLLPGHFHIIELHTGEGDRYLSRDGGLVSSFAAIIQRAKDVPPFLVLGDRTTKTLFIADNSTPVDPLIEIFRSQLVGWKEKYMDPHSVEPNMERTLLSVYIAEAFFRNLLPITRVPSSRDLRLHYLGELLAPYERNAVLEQCGIIGTLVHPQKIDTRVMGTQPMVPPSHADEMCIPVLENFNMKTLRQAFLQKPTEISHWRCIRILQIINEIGSPHILRAIKLAHAKPPRHEEAQSTYWSFVEKLFCIHLYLDTQENQSYIIVARNRYIKYCYYETYQLAVKALQEEKRSSHQERRKVSARRSTASYKHGVLHELPTPHTDRINTVYKDLSDAEKTRRAPDMVKDEIAQKIATFYKEDRERIRPNITRYIKEGKVLHHILQSAVCLNPGLLILFPSQESQPPALQADQFGFELTRKERNSLSKPIKMKEYGNSR